MTAAPSRPTPTGRAAHAGRTMIARTERYTFHVVRDADASDPLGQTLCRDAPAASQIARHVIGDAITEVLLVIFLDARQRVLGFSEVARGTLNTNRFTPKDVLIPALLANAASLVVAHNQRRPPPFRGGRDLHRDAATSRAPDRHPAGRRPRGHAHRLLLVRRRPSVVTTDSRPQISRLFLRRAAFLGRKRAPR